MLKLYFGNSVAIISTLLLGANLGYIIWGYLNRAAIQKWGMIILLLILLYFRTGQTCKNMHPVCTD